MRQKIQEILGELFEIPVNDVDESVEMASTPGWDSMRHLEIVSAIEHTFNIVLEIEEILEIKSFLKIFEIFEKRGGY